MRHAVHMSATAPGHPAYEPWPVAWQRALYGPAGFYRQHAPAHHFVTSAQGIPGGGELLAQAVIALARRHSCTRVVEIGAGRGELLVLIRALAPELSLTGVDVVPMPENVVGRGIDWQVTSGGSALPPAMTDLEDTLLLAHEWLDVIPCPIVERDDAGSWRQVLVETSSGRERLGPPVDDEQRAWLTHWVDDSAVRAEVGFSRDHAWADLVSRLTSGLAVVVDYGHEAPQRPLHGTLTGFSRGQQVSPVPDGSCDLTAHVAIDSLAAATPDPFEVRVARQSRLLAEVLAASGTGQQVTSGIGQGTSPGSPIPHELARTDPAAYLEALVRQGAWRALTAPGGLGDFHWVLASPR